MDEEARRRVTWMRGADEPTMPNEPAALYGTCLCLTNGYRSESGDDEGSSSSNGNESSANAAQAGAHDGGVGLSIVAVLSRRGGGGGRGRSGCAGREAGELTRKT